VMLGTIYPMIADYFFSQKISVGAPFFNLFFIPFMAILMIFLSLGVVSRWKKTDAKWLGQQVWPAALFTVVFSFLFPAIYGVEYTWQLVVGIALSSWVMGVTFADVYRKAKNKAGYLAGLKKLSLSYWGMTLGHLGVAVSAVGICIVSNYTKEHDVRMVPGDKVEASGYEFIFDGVRRVPGPNYTAEEGVVRVFDEGEFYTTMRPQKRQYAVQRNVMTEADINAGLFRDLYIALGEKLEGDAWALRIHYKPYVRWIWLGSIFMALGGFIAVSDRRYRLKAKKTQAATSAQA